MESVGRKGGYLVPALSKVINYSSYHGELGRNGPRQDLSTSCTRVLSSKREYMTLFERTYGRFKHLAYSFKHLAYSEDHLDNLLLRYIPTEELTTGYFY